MKLYINEKVFALRTPFSVRDEDGAEKYIIQSKKLMLNDMLYMTDPQGTELASFRMNWFVQDPFCSVSVAGEEIARVRKEHRKGSCSRYVVDSLGWEIEDGSLLFADFQICCQGQLMGRITQQWPSWGRSYCLEIGEPGHMAAAVAVVLFIDYMREMSKGSD